MGHDATGKELRNALGCLGGSLGILLSVLLPGTIQAQGSGLTVPDWIQADQQARTVEITLVAGELPVNRHWNFNGFHHGNATVVVPQGYSVTVRLENRDPINPHSVAILSRVGDYPGVFEEPSLPFPGATTPSATSMRDATQPGATARFEFAAVSAGEYALVCLIPAHATGGMWIRLRISGTGALGLEATEAARAEAAGDTTGSGEARMAEEEAAPEERERSAGSRLFILRGCLGCHGASGRGGVGPDLAGTEIDFQAFLDQLRNPRSRMPPFPAEALSEEEARRIHGYLGQVPPPPERLRKDLPRGTLARSSCSECHQKLHPTITRQFHGSAMGKAGTQNPRVDYPLREISCADCHGTDHDTIMASKGRVPESTCATCHPTIYQEHVTDGGHSYGPGPGELGINWERNIAVPHYDQMPRKVMEMGCDPCHAVAGATADTYWSEEEQQYTDSSSLTYRNGCITCHTRHAFDLTEARKPEACYTCHMGPDHPNYEAYMSSKHGSIYGARGSDWDWTSPLPEAEWEAPSCAYCHMLYVDDDGTRHSSHDMSRKIIWGMGVQPASGQLEDITVQPENRAKRLEMIKVCLTCHSEDKARGYLTSADAHKLAGDALVIEARDILTELYDDGLIEPSHGRQSAGLLPGPSFTAVDLPSEFAQHWPAGLYYDVTSIEREYFDMFFFTNLKSYKGAFHMSPDYAWWYGYAATLGHLARLRDEAGGLREAEAIRVRTWFMLATGPLMVLLVLGAVWLGTRWWSGP